MSDYKKINITLKIYLEHSWYEGDETTQAEVTFTNANGESITLEYDTETRQDTLDELAADLSGCLTDHEAWWSKMIVQGKDLTRKIKELERQVKEHQKQAEIYRKWADQNSKDAQKYEQELQVLREKRTNEP